MTARIYRPSKNAMQSGKGKSQDWLLEFEAASARSVEPLMGYTSSSDMNSQVKLKFATQEEAVAYCVKNDIAYAVQAEQTQKRRTMAYTDNFQYTRVGMWTH
jgi:ETC complex I subunit conserved region